MSNHDTTGEASDQDNRGDYSVWEALTPEQREALADKAREYGVMPTDLMRMALVSEGVLKGDS